MKEKTKMKKTAILSRLLPYLLRYKMLLITCILLSIGGNLLAWVMIALLLILYRLDKYYPEIMADLAERESANAHSQQNTSC